MGTAPFVFAAPTDYSALRNAIEDILEKEGYDDGSYGPLFVRLAWHAAGTYDTNLKNGGSNGATMRFEPECSWGANKGLDVARQVLEKVKKAYPNVSYADLWTLAGSVAIESMGGPKINWIPGRTDAPDGKKIVPDGRLPNASKGADHVRDVFERLGFDDKETVALIGAHCLGRCHTDRSGFEGPWTRAPTTFSNEYFRLLLEEKWTVRKWKGPKQYENQAKDLMMLPADMALLDDPKYRKHVELFAKDEQAFFKEFSGAWKKLLELGVKF